MHRATILLISLACIVSCSKPSAVKAPLNDPDIRIGFSNVHKLIEKELGIKWEPINYKHNAYVRIFSVKGTSPTDLPKIAGHPLSDYAISRQDILLRTDSKDFELTFFKAQEFADWYKSIHVSIDSQRFEAQKENPFFEDHPMYRTDDAPFPKAGATSLKETDLRIIVLKADGKFQQQPKIEIKPTFARLQCVSDRNGHWAGTILAFTPEMGIPQITVDGKAIKLSADPHQTILVHG